MSQRLKYHFPLWPKQRQARNSIANELVFGGAAGPGKSHTSRVLGIEACLEIPGLQVFYFRRKFKDVQIAMEAPTGLRSMLQPLVELGFVEIVKQEVRFKNGPGNSFVGGSRIFLCHCFHEQDVLAFKSYEFHFLIVEEATEFTPFQLKFLRSRVRMPDSIEIPKKYLYEKKYWLNPKRPRYMFPRILMPTNPGGPGHNYIKQGWIDSAAPYEIHIAPDNEGGMIRQYIPGLLTDNPSIDPEQYALTLSGLPPAYRDALLKGLWTAGIGSFFPEYHDDIHMLPDCDLDDTFYRFRTMDWGSSDPFAVHWWAIASKPCVIHGRYIPAKALICYNEWYGCLDDDGSKGIGLPNAEIARGILARSEEGYKKVITLADSFPFPDRGGWTIEKVFQDNGVPLTRADDSRVQGWSQLRDALKGIEIEKDRPRVPMIYFFQSVKYARTYLPMLQYHPSEAKPQDAEERGEATHCCDSVRYAAMAHRVIKHLKEEKSSLATHNDGPTMRNSVQHILKRIKKSGPSSRL